MKNLIFFFFFSIFTLGLALQTISFAEGNVSHSGRASRTCYWELQDALRAQRESYGNCITRGKNIVKEYIEDVLNYVELNPNIE